MYGTRAFVDSDVILKIPDQMLQNIAPLWVLND